MKKSILLLILVVTSNLFAQKDYTKTYDSDEIITNGVVLYEKEKYDESIAEYDRVSKSDPNYSRAQYEKALSLVALEKKLEVRELLDKLYADNKMVEEPNLFTLYGSFLSDAKEFDKSDTIFKEGEKLTPNSTNLLYNYAILKYRKEEFQNAVDILKKIITINPNSASAHYLLGAICMDNGKITEGSLAMMSYLIIAPTGSKAKDAILVLNKKLGENFLDKNKLVFSKSGDNFEEIETILRNELPLRKAYKAKSDIDDVITRQLQAIVEYAADHKIGDGFFETTYIPWVKDLAQKNQFEGFSYYILLSIDDNLGKTLTSKKKVITDFYKNYIDGDFWNHFGKRKLDHFGKEEEVVISIDNSRPFLVGKIINGKKEGKYKLLDEYGNTIGELNVENDNLEGNQKYYDFKGNTNEEKNYNAGKLNGERKTYYDNGEIKTFETYKDDKTDGLSYSKHVTGGKECEGNFINGERDGKFICYYANGSKQTELNYSKGKLNGTYTTYNEVGDITGIYNYVNDELDGKTITYYNGKALKSEATYSNGKIQGTYKSYFIDGVIEEEIFYENNKIKKSIEYYENGKKSVESIYDENEKLQTHIYYDTKGQLYYQENFKGGELKTVLQFSKDNPKPVESNITKKAFSVKNLDGKLILTGEYNKGERTGDWNYYYKNGALQSKKVYKNNNLDGLCYFYRKNGTLESKVNYANDSINGISESYENDKLTKEFLYSGNEKNGPYKLFYPDGSVREEGFYVAGDLNYYLIQYWMNGNIMKREKYEDDVLIAIETYSTSGKKENEFDFRNKNGKFNISYNNGMVIHSFELVNGRYNGKYTVKDKFNSIKTEAEFVNGIRNGNYKSYTPTGAIEYENNFYSGYGNGDEKSYDLVGNLKYLEQNVFGTEYGNSQSFFVNKAKINDYKRVNSNNEGEYTYFNSQGNPILKLGYEYDELKYYIQLGKTGQLNEHVEIIDETANIESKYANGKTAMIINFVKGAKDGKYGIYSPDGKPEIEINFKLNAVNGERKNYYPNGTIYRIERMLNNNFEGTQEYYKEDGKIWLKAEYKNDELHGNTLIYNNGVLTTTKKYDTGELVEISK